MPLVQGVDDVFNADDAHQNVVGQDGHTRDAVVLHQVLNGTQGIRGGGGDGQGGHRIAHPQFIDQQLGEGDLPFLAGVQNFPDCEHGGHGFFRRLQVLSGATTGGRGGRQYRCPSVSIVLFNRDVHDLQRRQPAPRPA